MEMEEGITNCAVLILAAGKSERLGRPKQLLEFEGERLVRRAGRMALAAEIGRVYVVLGANAEKVSPELDLPELLLVHNNEWEEGMASSIRAGLNAALAVDEATDGVMVVVCDQPHLDAGVLQKLVEGQRSSGLPVAASAYGGRAGTPAIFHRSLFPQLLKLRGDAGARKLIAEMGNDVLLLPFEKGEVDIDTMDDYIKLTADK